MKTIIAISILCLLPLSAYADTIVPGNIATDTTWSAAAGPYIIDSNFSVAASTTLTIDPGTVVKVKTVSSNTSFPTILGNLVAHGTAQNPITFTTIEDDSVGGDTNGDGTSTTPMARSWQGLYFEPGSSGDLDYVTVAYGGGIGAGDHVGIENDGGSLTVNHSYIHDNYAAGIFNKAGTLNVSNSSIFNQAINVEVLAGTTTISNTQISNGSNYGLYDNSSDLLTLLNNTFSGNTRTATVNAATGLIHNGNTSADLSYKGFYLPGYPPDGYHLHSRDLPLIYSGSAFLVGQGTTVYIDPGTIIKLGDGGSINVSGDLEALGTSDKPIIFTSLKNDSVGGDTNGDGALSMPAKRDWSSIVFNPGSKGTFLDAIISYAGQTGSLTTSIQTAVYNFGGDLSFQDSFIGHNFNQGIYQDDGTTTATNLELTDQVTGALVVNGSLDIHQSEIHDNIGDGIQNSGPVQADARNNWWGSSSGPRAFPDNATSTGQRISGDILYSPWLTSDPTNMQACCSSVLFLPGLEASRLYKQKTVLGITVEDQLWEPNLSIIVANDVSNLYLNPDGSSIIKNIYTKDIIDSTNVLGPIFSLNIYKDLIANLDNLVSTGKISDWNPYAYDWRQGIDDLVQYGTQYNNGQRVSLIDTLQSLVSESKTGNVTIIAHSNGGLLAKALIKKLVDIKASGQSNLIDHVDNLIMVSSPQLGTPDGFSGILHGYGQTLPLGLMTANQARELAQNMSSAYSLLPSKNYFDQAGVTPVAVFASTSAQMYRTAYGPDISSYQEEHNFVSGVEGRAQAADSDLISPLIGNTALLAQAETLHDSIDNLFIPSLIKVIDIAGWGKETISGITYTDSDIQPIFTIRGDSTVVMTSALYGQGTQYWLDLSQSSLNHQSILEDPQLLDFITNTIEQNFASSTIATTEPIQVGNRLHLSVHSPVSIGVYDSQGNFTGKVCDDTTGDCAIEENIPGSTYFEFGEGKYINLGQGDILRAVLQGTDTGTFTLDSDIVTPSGQTTESAFIDIPVTTQTQAQVTLDQNTGVPQLTLDVTGDGVTDFTLSPSAIFDPVTYLRVVRVTIDSLDLTPAKIKAFDARVDNIIKSIQKGKIDKAKLKADKFQKILQARLAMPDPNSPKPKKLSKTDAQILLDLINQLLDNLT